MGGRPTNIPEPEKTRPDGTLFTRVEMEAQLREIWPGHAPKRLRAINPYGLLSKIAMDTPTIIVFHWLLDTMIKRGEITGDSLGVDIPSPGYYDNPEMKSQFAQRLMIAIEQGAAMQPEPSEGIDMTTMTMPPPPVIPGGAVPPNGQSGAAYVPPVAPQMPGAPPAAPPAAAPQTTAVPAAAGPALFPKNDPTRPWGKPSPTAERTRRTKQEMGEDMLWDSLKLEGTTVQFGTFEQVYGMTYAKAKKQKLLGPGGEFPALVTAAAQPPTQQPQVPTMNQPPQAPPAPHMAAPGAPPPAPPAPQAPGAPPPMAQAPQAPQAPGVPPGVPVAAHPHAPPVPPAPGTAPAGAMPQMPQMPPSAQAPAAAVDLSPVLKQQTDIINRLAAIETTQKAIDAAVSLLLQDRYQKPGAPNCAATLQAIGVPVPQ